MAVSMHLKLNEIFLTLTRFVKGKTPFWIVISGHGCYFSFSLEMVFKALVAARTDRFWIFNVWLVRAIGIPKGDSNK